MLITHTNFDLSHANSFGLDVSCRRFITFDNPEELTDYKAYKLIIDEQVFILGGGTNVLFTGDYNGTIIHPVNQSIELVRETGDRVWITAGAGLNWDLFVEWCVSRGYCGLENLSGIPGNVGAAPVQNIGAYGVEVSEYIEQIEGFDPEIGGFSSISAGEAGFGYRTSVFKKAPLNRWIITRVGFQLNKNWNPNLSYKDLRVEFESLVSPTIRQVREAVIKIRSRKLPDPLEIGNAGSFFKNPVITEAQYRNLKAHSPDAPVYPLGNGWVKISAAWLIDKAGWKGYREGQVGVNPNQPLVLVAFNDATGTEIVDLAKKIKESVSNRFGIRLDEEVTVV